jgi:hypothetical protein
MTSTLRIVACTIAGVLWLLALIAKHFWPDIDIAMFATTCAGVIGAIGIHGMANGTNVTTVESVKAAQSGFASPRLLALIAAVALIAGCVSGCTTTTGAMYRGYATEAKAGIQTWDDNSLATMHDLLCAQPYSAIQRHPELQPGIVALCGPLVNTASLDPTQVSADAVDREDAWTRSCAGRCSASAAEVSQFLTTLDCRETDEFGGLWTLLAPLAYDSEDRREDHHSTCGVRD